MKYPLFGKIISKHVVNQDIYKLHLLTEMPPPKVRKELQSFFSVLNYGSKFLSAIARVGKLLHKQISVNIEWTLNKSY